MFSLKYSLGEVWAEKKKSTTLDKRELGNIRILEALTDSFIFLHPLPLKYCSLFGDRSQVSVWDHEKTRVSVLLQCGCKPPVLV